MKPVSMSEPDLCELREGRHGVKTKCIESNEETTSGSDVPLNLSHAFTSILEGAAASPMAGG